MREAEAQPEPIRNAEPKWEPPGKGRWTLERSHFGGEFTVAYQEVYQRAQHDGTKATLARYGMPGAYVAIEYINDRPYSRLVPPIDPPARLATRPPPRWAVWLLGRAHPRFRRGARNARRMLATRMWREEGRRWYEEQRPAVIAANLALQREPIEAMSDAEVADHLERCVANSYDGVRLHFELVGPNAFPVGDLMVAAAGWGITPGEALGLLAGASPASADSARLLAADDVDRYLELYGWRAVANYDVDAPTIGEMPGVLEAARKAVAAKPLTDAVPNPDMLRTRVPEGDRSWFDELLAEARYAYGLRDDNAGPTLQWTVGLLRRVLLEAGRRLAAAGKVTHPEDTFDLRPGETAALLRGATSPSAAEVQTRVDRRRANNALPAPSTLGPDEALPDISPFPPALRRVGASFVIQAEHLYSPADVPPLSGVGIGTTSIVGPARVVRSAEDAFDRLQAGEVLVTTMTTPAYDAVLPMVAGLVVEEGGMLSHAAIVAREFGLPAVIGARGALDHITDGDTVEVDPVAGTVRVVVD